LRFSGGSCSRKPGRLSLPDRYRGGLAALGCSVLRVPASPISFSSCCCAPARAAWLIERLKLSSSMLAASSSTVSAIIRSRLLFGTCTECPAIASPCGGTGRRCPPTTTQPPAPSLTPPKMRVATKPGKFIEPPPDVGSGHLKDDLG